MTNHDKNTLRTVTITTELTAVTGGDGETGICISLLPLRVDLNSNSEACSGSWEFFLPYGSIR